MGSIYALRTVPACLVKVQCVGFGWQQKLNLTFLIMFSFVYNHLQLLMIVFSVALSRCFVFAEEAGGKGATWLKSHITVVNVRVESDAGAL